MRILDECIVELVTEGLQEVPLVSYSCHVHVLPHIELHFQVTYALGEEILRGKIWAEDLITYGSCHCAASLVVACQLECHPE